MSDGRRFHAGESGELRGGFEYRVIAGSKGPTDLVLQLRNGSGFRHVPMELGFLITDFFVENESELYREDLRYEGGRFYLRKLREVVQRGWRPVAQELQSAREQRRRRDAA